MKTKTAKTPKTVPPAPGADVRTPAVQPHWPKEVTASLPLKIIRPSPLNPRKTFDADALAELAASIREHSLLQPIVVRPRGERIDFANGLWVNVEHFEVVCGERRRRAAELAGLDAVPVVVRPMDDDAVLAVMLVENDQRKDVLPSEQAVAYKRLAEAVGLEGAAKAAGKPVSAVREILRLALLPAWCLKAVDDGTLSRSAAAVVARVPGEENRERAAAAALVGQWQLPKKSKELAAHVAKELKREHRQAAMTVREVKELVTKNYSRELKGAPFDRKSLTLVPDAGSCDACPKRAGNDPDLRAEGVREDVCTDTDCFTAKVAANVKVAEVKAAEKGLTVIKEKLTWPRWGDGQPPPGWTDLDAKADWCSDRVLSALAQTNFKGKKLRTILTEKKLEPKVYFTVDDDNMPRELLKTADVHKLLLDAKLLKKEKDPRPGGGQRGIVAWQIDNRASLLAARKVWEKGNSQSNVKAALLLATRALVRLVDCRDTAELLFKDLVPEIDLDEGYDVEQIDTALQSLPTTSLVGFMAGLLTAELGESYGANREFVGEFHAFADLDAAALKKLRKDAEAELKAEEKAKAEAAKATKKGKSAA